MERRQHWQCYFSCSAVSWLLALLQALHRLPKGNRYRDCSELSTALLCYETSVQVTSEFVLLPTGCIALDFTPL